MSNNNKGYVDIFSDMFRKNFSAEEVSKQRMEICKSCPSLIAMNRCKECGCFMDVKTKLARFSCPLGKWKEV
jgi:membrane protease subunit (stomatin/prohibitin family)